MRCFCCVVKVVGVYLNCVVTRSDDKNMQKFRFLRINESSEILSLAQIWQTSSYVSSVKEGGHEQEGLEWDKNERWSANRDGEVTREHEEI